MFNVKVSNDNIAIYSQIESHVASDFSFPILEIGESSPIQKDKTEQKTVTARKIGHYALKFFSKLFWYVVAFKHFLKGAQIVKHFNAESLVDKKISLLLTGSKSENEMLITENAKETIQLKQELIKNAQSHIFISGSYCGGKVFDETLALISERLELNPHLQVRIITNVDLLSHENKKNLEELKTRYSSQFDYLITYPRWVLFPTLKKQENHTKIVAVDGQAFITGGTGIQDMLTRSEANDTDPISWKEKLVAKGASDMDIVGYGNLGAAFDRQFELLWNKWQTIMFSNKKDKNLLSKELLSLVEINKEELSTKHRSNLLKNLSSRFKKVQATLFVGSPEQLKNNNCKKTYLKIIQEAKDSLVIANMAINDKEIVDAIAEAAKRNVKVKIITNGNNKTSPFSVGIMGPRTRRNYNKIMGNSSNVKIYEFNKPGIIYHKKILIADEQIAIYGSYNITKKSAKCDAELIVTVDSKEQAKETLNILKKGRKSSNQILRHQTDLYEKSFKAKVLNLFLGGIFN